MEPTNINNPEYFHKVVDCQYACPSHTPVPQYLRLIAAGKYTESYMINWDSNVFPGVLGRTCDRPCEPACRRGRVEKKPVAICRLKRVAADHKNDVKKYMPQGPFEPNGKKIALIGGGPASLTVARDLAPMGYEIHLYDDQKKGGGFMRSQIPSFRLPEEVLDEEVGYILDLGIHTHFNHYVSSMKEVLEKGYDAIFVGTGAPRGRNLNIPGRQEGDENIHIGINWLANVAFEHTDKIGEKVIVLGGGNTAMDCCRTARRLGGKDVKVVVRSPFADMKASEWEKEDTLHEDIPIIDNHVPKSFVIKDGKLAGMLFEKVKAVYDENGKRSLVPTDEPEVFIEADDVLIAIGQENSFPWIERDLGIEFNKWGMPVLDEKTFASTHKNIFFGGDAALGPKNIITSVAQGHQAAISIHLMCEEMDIKKDRPSPFVNLRTMKMGIHEWSYDSQVVNDSRYLVPQADKSKTLNDIKLEVELGYDELEAFKEAQRCLNCDIQTVFDKDKCIECDACVDVCPTDCITFTTNEEDEFDLRAKLNMPALNTEQDLYVSDKLPTARIMVKDENVCLHCGLCAERCPTSAWDMQQFYYNVTKAHNVGNKGKNDGLPSVAIY
ncbi:MAG: FAD-dependent oxidoreductase [Weeksellaceae bacterium]|jgi:NADPH-dependent glutamate synthase beta subunit-like oxidoreductase|nr:FAD-dependent oxidoreductase [Weeksellaceae bacterium]MDX9704622.1 FAD-dependent oxidoreductase [Weeksellaceae bacterium]